MFIVAKALFGKQRDKVKLERRQSVAVMQHANKTPKKQQLHKSPRSKNILLCENNFLS